ncbi:hypothetical protein PG2000B_0305 [Bifidobacterium pseudolongum subsp. globosum]|uniref:hypothetical protein n=1 Tax=Bifidobacterium pseudolongum TaxID=1694 RepID=UPI001020BC3F|nr:hypothetical protein [Bifidobacterium pseudolongum]RYQ44479.1 hypothetical protein PG2000B_0305 [Bifidobacterium pseudolongum subsp. globosum]
MNDINFEALRGLWLAYGGEPDKELQPEAHGRYMAARMAEERRPDSRLSEFDEWARRERREQDEAEALNGIRDALEQFVEVADACRLNHVESLTCGELMEGVTFSSEAFHEYDGTGETLHSYVRLALDDMGLGFDVRAINDEPAECYGDATAEWHFQSPAELHALASAFRTKYAYLLDMVATTWAQLIADGTIPAPEA